MKFPMAHGIEEIHGDQDLVYHCYHIVLWETRAIDAYSVEGMDAHDDLVKWWEKLIEDLISIPLVDGNPKHAV